MKDYFWEVFRQLQTALSVNHYETALTHAGHLCSMYREFLEDDTRTGEDWGDEQHEVLMALADWYRRGPGSRVEYE